MALRSRWVDYGREPKQKPNPAYPDGIDMDMRHDKDEPSCRMDLPYPAPRCGVHMVTCDVCHLSIAITTAGRPDDPRSVRVSCMRRVDSTLQRFIRHTKGTIH